MAETRRLGLYELRKKPADTENKENRQPVKKKLLKESQGAQKNRAIPEPPQRKDGAGTNKMKFKETAFRVYVDNENENVGETNERGAGRKIYNTRSKDAKAERGLPRIVIDSERKDTLSRRGKVISNKNDGQRIHTDKEPSKTNVNHERLLRNRLPAVIKPDVKLQKRKDGSKLAPVMPISRRSSCTDATEEKHRAPKTSLRKAASVTSLPAVTSEDVTKRSKRLFEGKVLKRTASALSVAVSRQGREGLTKKLSPAVKPALRNIKENKRNLQVSDTKQVQSNVTSVLYVINRPRSKSAELVESNEKNLQSEVPESNKIKRSEKKWRVRFRSTDESVLKNLKSTVARKTSTDYAQGLQESDQNVFKTENVIIQIPSTLRMSSNMCSQAVSLNAEQQIMTITPEDCAPVPTPKKAKLEHKISESETGVDRKIKETAPPPCELAYHLQYIDDTMETEWEKQNNSHKLSPDFLKRNMNPEQRRIIVSFLIHVGYHCHYPSFIMYQTVKLFDAAMDIISLDVTNFQLAALACLFISLKREETIHKVPTASTILSFAKDQYEGRTDLLLKCEQHILCQLKFQITFGDPYTIFVYYLFHCKQYVQINEELTSQLYYSAGYVIDISLLEEDFCHVSPILLGITAAELLFCLFIDACLDYAHPRWLYWRSLIERDRKNPERFCSKTIDTLRRNLIRNILHSCQHQSSFKTVYKKYRLNRYGKISDILIEKMVKLPWDQYLEMHEM